MSPIIYNSVSKEKLERASNSVSRDRNVYRSPSSPARVMQAGDREFHRKTAVECFNRAWDYLDKKDRTVHDDHLMLHLAHASRYHWSFVGTPRNLAVGDWQISRVYAALGQSDLSLHFAKTSLEIGEKNSLPEVVLTANEAMARAYATGKNYQLARSFLDKAKTQLRTASLDEEDRNMYAEQ